MFLLQILSTITQIVVQEGLKGPNLQAPYVFGYYATDWLIPEDVAILSKPIRI